MIKIFITILLIWLFLISGAITQGLKKLLSLITSLLLKILNFFGIKIIKKEKQEKMSAEFKATYKDIKMIKLSKKNIKQKSSIDYLNLGLLITTMLLIILNLGSVTGNAISNWLFTLIKPLNIIKNTADMNTFYTAILFSVLSFTLSKLVQRWKETKQQRLDIKRNRLKSEALKLMDSKELLDNARKKDIEIYKELK